MEVTECMSDIISTDKKLYSMDPAPVKIRTVTGTDEASQTTEPLVMGVQVILTVNAGKKVCMCSCAATHVFRNIYI